MPGLTALKGLISMQQGRRLTPDYITNLPRGSRPLPIHAAPRFGLWSPTLMTYAHQHTRALWHAHSLTFHHQRGKQQTALALRNVRKKQNPRGGRSEATRSSPAALNCRLNNTRRAVSTLSALTLQRGRVIQEGQKGPVHLRGYVNKVETVSRAARKK